MPTFALTDTTLESKRVRALATEAGVPVKPVVVSTTRDTTITPATKKPDEGMSAPVKVVVTGLFAYLALKSFGVIK